MKATGPRQLSTVQQRYTHNFDKSVRWETPFKIEDYIIIEVLQLATIWPEAVGDTTNCRYNWLLQQTSGMYKEQKV